MKGPDRELWLYNDWTRLWVVINDLKLGKDSTAVGGKSKFSRFPCPLEATFALATRVFLLLSTKIQFCLLDVSFTSLSSSLIYFIIP